YPYAMVLADFVGGDGKLDIAVANSESHTISVYRNLSVAGTFTNSSLLPKSDFPAGTGPRFIDAADVDGDGLIDVVNANLSSSSFSVHRNIAGARFLISPFKNGMVFRFRADALPDSAFVVQISTNLIDWSDVATTTITNFLGASFVDSNAVLPYAFYRLRNP
ncbi:MAG TPA: VCBS repeat-containing protein, partial [Methylomirabilota bacterium]|nr:VCBS repeat-containing protein [Methylomirabilota bacterium]